MVCVPCCCFSMLPHMLFYTSNAKMSQKARLSMPLYTKNACFLYLVAPQCFLTEAVWKGKGKGKGKVPGWEPASAAVHSAGSAHCFVVCLAAEVPDLQRLGTPCWLSGEAQCEAWHLVPPVHHKVNLLLTLGLNCFAKVHSCCMLACCKLL